VLVIDRLKSVPAREWVAPLKRAGFELCKGKGSHHVYQHAYRRRVVVASNHNLGDTFGPKTIQQMLRFTGWNEKDVQNELKPCWHSARLPARAWPLAHTKELPATAYKPDNLQLIPRLNLRRRPVGFAD